jgi:hypothetical protein
MVGLLNDREPTPNDLRAILLCRTIVTFKLAGSISE